MNQKNVAGRLALLSILLLVSQTSPGGEQVRFATFNTSLASSVQGGLAQTLVTGSNYNAQRVAEVIQRVNPDVILLNEFDYDEAGLAISRFQQNYLSVSQNGAGAIQFPYVYIAPVNTGVPSGYDFNNDGSTTGPDDAYGYGLFPGQYGMVVLSKHPILENRVRTFQQFLWKDMPGALLPENPPGTSYYTQEELDVFRLSSKSHWDVPVNIGGHAVHALASHPTPPVFDGAEDRNGKRNSDEIRLWADYITPGAGGYLYDDEGQAGGLGEDKRFVVLGDLNADPVDGDSYPGAVNQLLNSPQVNTTRTPSSTAYGTDTADWYEDLRVDYALPSATLGLSDAAVYWPAPGDPYDYLESVSDHHLVWVDLVVPDAIEGDSDYDGDIDANDLAALGLNWAPNGSGAIWEDGDFDADGDVDANDLAALGLNWDPVGTVPEPATLTLLVLAAILRRRRN